jgi:UDP-N-acetyl-D-glucosamine dehydrogenase
MGLGYVGLPLAREAAHSGLRVVGYDLDADLVEQLNLGRSHVGDVSDSEIAEMRAKGFRATAVEADIGFPDIVVICVPTPLATGGAPDLTAVCSAAKTVGRLLRPGMVVILESTTYPGTTDEVVRPLLEEASGLVAGTDFSLAFSPERIDPGNQQFGVRNTPKVVGGLTPACTDAAVGFYGKVCDVVVRAKSSREAEMAKLLENTYRYVNIALVNEMAIFSHELGVDLWDAIQCAATKPFGFHAEAAGSISGLPAVPQ